MEIEPKSAGGARRAQVFGDILGEHSSRGVDQAENVGPAVLGALSARPKFFGGHGVGLHEIREDGKPKFLGGFDERRGLIEGIHVASDANEVNAAISREPQVVFRANARNKEGSEAGAFERVGGRRQVLLIRCRLLALPLARRAKAQPVAHLDEANPRGFQCGRDERGVFGGELEVDDVGAVAQRGVEYFEGLARH